MTSTIANDSSCITPRPKSLHTTFDGVAGLSYKSCCLIDRLLARHGQVYLRHVEICLFRRDSAYPLPEEGALEYFHWNLSNRIIEVLSDIGLESQGEVHYQLLPGQYGLGETHLQILLMMTQQAFRGLGNEEQSAEEVLEELLCDSWAGIQGESFLHPVCLTSRIQGVGSVYLSSEQRAQGAMALSAMLEFCHAKSWRRLQQLRS